MPVLRRVSLPFVLAAAALAQHGRRADFDRGRVVVDGEGYGYRLLAPLPECRHVPQPLVVFLHGAGERGDDGERHLRWLPERLAEAGARRRWPCWVLCVQCPDDERWVDADWDGVRPQTFAAAPTRPLRAVLAALDRVASDPGVDPNRVYLTGLSMGGFGAFDLAARVPERFAALLAVCGGGAPSTAHRLLGLPTTVYHGAADDVVPVVRSRIMVAALREVGAPVDYRELDGVGHDAWRVAYGPDGALDWLFAQDQRQQRRGLAARPPLIPAADSVALHGGVFELARGARCLASGTAQPAARVLLDALATTLPVRPGLVDGGVPRAGDLVFEVAPGLGAVYELVVDDVLRVRAADAEGMLRGAAAVWQALRTHPEPTCPRGRWLRTRPIAAGTVVCGVSGGHWPARDLREAIRTCWSYGADALAGPGFERLWWLDAPERERVLDDAARHGVRLLGLDAGTRAVDAVVFDGRRAPIDAIDLAAELRRPVPAAAPAQRYVVHLPPADPADVRRRLRLQLPAAVERLDRGERPVHVGGFLTRLGQLLRYD